VGIAVVAMAATACGAGPGASTTGPIKVAFEVPLTGNFAANGAQEKDGFALGLKQLGTKINGRSIQVSYADTRGDPATALTTARKLAQDGSSIFEGPLQASESAAVTPYLGQRKLTVDDLTLCSQIQLTTWTKAKNGMTSGWSCDQPSMMAAEWAYNVMHWRHISIQATDFSFGWEVAGGFAAAFKKLGGTITNTTYIPSNATDLSSYVSQIPRNVDAVYAEVSGALAVKFTTAYQSFGLHGKIPLLGVTQLTDQSVLPNEDPAAVQGDVYTGAQYCDGIDTPVNNTFVKDYQAAYHQFPGYYSDAGYVKAQILVSALRTVKGDTSDSAKLTQAMRQARVRAPRGPISISPKTYSPIQNSYICQVKKVGGKLREIPIKTYTNVQPQGPLDYNTWLSRFKHDSAGRPAI
jgi:branched-chain amino acid transport system substrate-binding protein